MLSKLRFKRIMTFLSILTIVLVLAGCAGSGSGSQMKKVDLKAGERVKVTFWHAMGGNLGEATQKLVDEFNAAQDKVQVEAVYQGTYDDALQKFKASGPNGPTLIQVYEIGSRFMIDSGLVTPVQAFMDADNFKVADMEENILAYYKFDGKFYSMPFNTSTPIMYYNKTAFKEAGLDPEKPPKTFAEFKDAAKKLTKKTGNDTRYGASIALYGWFFEQFVAVQGGHLVDNENGRKAKATKALLDSTEGQNFVKLIKETVDEGGAINLGRKTSETQAAFQAGQVAMTFDSTAVLTRLVNGAQGKFEVGTAFLPRPADSKGGVIIGGASIWITNLKPEKEQWAAWEFLKWMASPQTQAKWSIATGYFPVTKTAYNEQVLKDAHAKLPQYKTAVDQLRASQVNPVTQGAVMGVFKEARQRVEEAMEEAVLGKKSVADALKTASTDVTKAIEDYNKTTK